MNAEKLVSRLPDQPIPAETIEKLAGNLGYFPATNIIATGNETHYAYGFSFFMPSGNPDKVDVTDPENVEGDAVRFGLDDETGQWTVISKQDRVTLAKWMDWMDTYVELTDAETMFGFQR